MKTEWRKSIDWWHEAGFVVWCAAICFQVTALAFLLVAFAILLKVMAA